MTVSQQTLRGDDLRAFAEIMSDRRKKEEFLRLIGPEIQAAITQAGNATLKTEIARRTKSVLRRFRPTP